MYACACVSVCQYTTCMQEPSESAEGVRSLELVSTVAVSYHHMVLGPWYLCKSSERFYLLSHLSTHTQSSDTEGCD